MTIMYFSKVVLSLAALAGSAVAQSGSILSPVPGTELTAGGNTTVQISVTDNISSLDEVSIVLGLAACTLANGACPTASYYLGNILYQGPFNPITADRSSDYQFYENFTVTVPENLPAGTASLGVLRVYLIGDEYEPEIEYLNENVTIVAS